MGMDFLVCHVCGQGFSDYEDYGNCAICENALCEKCNESMIKKFGRVDEDSEFAEDYGDNNPMTCDVCTGNIIEETEFVKFLVKQIGKTKEVLEEEFRRALKSSKEDK